MPSLVIRTYSKNVKNNISEGENENTKTLKKEIARFACAVVCSRLAGARLKKLEKKHSLCMAAFICPALLSRSNRSESAAPSPQSTTLTQAPLTISWSVVAQPSTQITCPHNYYRPTQSDLNIQTFLHFAASYQECCETNWINGKEQNKNERKALGGCCYYYSSLFLRYDERKQKKRNMVFSRSRSLHRNSNSILSAPTNGEWRTQNAKE